MDRSQAKPGRLVPTGSLEKREITPASGATPDPRNGGFIQQSLRHWPGLCHDALTLVSKNTVCADARAVSKAVRLRMTSEPDLNKTDSDDHQMMMMMWSLMSSDVGLTYWGQTVTNACVWFSVALRPQKPYGSLGRGAQDGHLDFHTAPELSATKLTVQCCYASSWVVSQRIDTSKTTDARAVSKAVRLRMTFEPDLNETDRDNVVMPWLGLNTSTPARTLRVQMHEPF